MRISRGEKQKVQKSAGKNNGRSRHYKVKKTPNTKVSYDSINARNLKNNPFDNTFLP